MLLDVTRVQIRASHELLLEFENGERRVFDMTRWLEEPPYHLLKGSPAFLMARVAYGTVVWPGDIDIAPETLYDESVPVSE
jgi:hypothetical protein